MGMGRRPFLRGAAAVGLASVLPGRNAFARSAPLTDPGFILGKGPEGWCDEAKNGGAVVRWHEQDRKWWMWYYARDNNFPEDVAPLFGTGRIAVAKSDDGISWTRFKGPLTGGAVMEWSDNPDDFDATHVASGDVTYHNGEWLLWYFGGDSTIPGDLGGYQAPNSYQHKGYRCRPGVARSKDGIHWERIRGTATGGASVDIDDDVYGAFPNGIHDGDRFLMYYASISATAGYWETLVAESKDLKNWTRLGPIKWTQEPARWELAGSNTRHIIPNPDSSGPRWLMVYTALDGRVAGYPRMIGAAVSDDALTWTRLYDEPIFHMGNYDRFDSGGVSYPQLTVHPSGAIYMYYYGFSVRTNTAGPTRGIGLAISEDGNLRNFRRVRKSA